MSVCECLDHDEKMSKEYKYSDVVCQDCCAGYCPSCSYHNGHPNQLVDGKLRICGKKRMRISMSRVRLLRKYEEVQCEEQECQQFGIATK